MIDSPKWVINKQSPVQLPPTGSALMAVRNDTKYRDNKGEALDAFVVPVILSTAPRPRLL
jgi:hypothetical protein